MLATVASSAACELGPSDASADAHDVRVSTRHAYMAEQPDSLSLTASGLDATVAWRRDARWWVGGRSVDAGRTFGAVQTLPMGPPAADDSPRLVLAPSDDRRWTVSGSPGRRGASGWIVPLPGVSNGGAPLAVQEYCGLVAVLSVEQRPAGAALVLRRYLPPLGNGLVEGMRVGLAVEIDRLTAASRLSAVPLPNAMLAAWFDTGQVRVARIELPSAVCGSRLLWQPLPTPVARP